MITKLLYLQPSELNFPFQSNKLSTCWLQLTNRTDHNVAFKVKTTHPRKYCVRPNVGIVSPGSTCVIRVGRHAQKERLPSTMPKDKFLIQSMIAPIGLTAENITSDMFRKESGNNLEEQKLKVSFVTASPPSPIPEVSEEEWSSEASELEKSEHKDSMSAFASDSASISEERPSKDWDIVSKLMEERSLALMERQKLQHKLEMTKKHLNMTMHSGRISILVVLLTCITGFILGYMLNFLWEQSL